MKINWGGGLVIGMILFISFILYFVIQIMTNDKYEYELVTEDYYSKEMIFQDQLYADRNSFLLEENIKSARTSEGVLFTFPENLKHSQISGTLSIYRPSNKKLDFDLPLKLNGASFLVPGDKLVEGMYNFIVYWEYEGKSYRYKDVIYY